VLRASVTFRDTFDSHNFVGFGSAHRSESKSKIEMVSTQKSSTWPRSEAPGGEETWVKGAVDRFLADHAQAA
jgi:hypothetical protein